LIGRVKITLLDLEVATDSTAVLVGAAPPVVAGPPLSLPRQSAEREGGRWCLPCFLGGHQ
jgi:hypothetical protein